MRPIPIFTACAFVIALAGAAPAAPPVQPWEVAAPWTAANGIDEAVKSALDARGIAPAHLCSDAVFIRRVYLDMLGILPHPREVNRFFGDGARDKRAALIEHLFAREEFADYWTLKWCDVLRVKAEFPINLWPNGVQAYHRWIHDAVRTNMPYDDFARALLTSSGSNFRVPPVNFYRAVQGHEPATLARAAALTFMGVRLEDWDPARAAGIEAFFSRVAFKGTAEWKEEIVYLDPAATEPFEAAAPGGATVRIAVGEDPRVAFADWLIRPDNPWFARNAVNRQWAWLMGRGIIHEPDDIRPDNAPANPALLEYLERELIAADYDMRHVMRLILNSRTYQQSAIPQSDDPDAERLFAHYAVRQLDAEVLIDALCLITGTRESYSSMIPEPFTFIPEAEHTVNLADGSITSQFLEMFGRPPRDTGAFAERNSAPNEAQRLHLLNSGHVQMKLATGWRLRDVQKGTRGQPRPIVNALYLHVLSRPPAPAELEAALDYFDTPETGRDQAVQDLTWALINSKEFLCRH